MVVEPPSALIVLMDSTKTQGGNRLVKIALLEGGRILVPNGMVLRLIPTVWRVRQGNTVVRRL